MGSELYQFLCCFERTIPGTDQIESGWYSGDIERDERSSDPFSEYEPAIDGMDTDHISSDIPGFKVEISAGRIWKGYKGRLSLDWCTARGEHVRNGEAVTGPISS